MQKIQKQILNVDYYDEAGVDQFYDKALHLFYQDLSPEMERIMNKHSDSEQIIRINRLTINLGLTYETELRTQWVSRFKEEFERELLHKITQIKNGQGSEHEAIERVFDNELEILIYYLKNGTLPWYASSHKVDISKLFDKMLVSDPVETNKRLRAENETDKLIRRMVIQLSDKQIERLIVVMQPSESVFIIQSAYEIRKAQQRDQVVKSGNREFRDAIWKFILAYIMNHRGSYFNTREFMSSLLHTIASHFNITFGQLIREIYKSILQLKSEPAYFRLGSLLQDIYKAHQQGLPKSIEREILNTQIAEFLLNGKTGNSNTAKRTPGSTSLLKKWMSDSPLELRQFLFDNAETEVLRKIVNLLPEPDMHQLFRVISPSEAAFVINFKEDINGLQEEHHWAGSGSDQFSADLWVVLLDIMLNDRGSLFNQKAFALHALDKLSKHYNLDSSYFIRQILGLIELQPKIISSLKLFNLFSEIRRDFVGNGRHIPSSEKIKIRYFFEHLQYIVNGKTPDRQADTIDCPFLIHRNKSEIIEFLLQRKPKILAEWMTQNLNSEAQAIKFFQELELSLLLKITQLLAPRRLNRLPEYVDRFLNLNQAFSLKKNALTGIGLYQLAFIFLVLPKQAGRYEDRFLIFMITRTAKELQLNEVLVLTALLQGVKKVRGLLSAETESYLQREFAESEIPLPEPKNSELQERKEINISRRVPGKIPDTPTGIDKDKSNPQLQRVLEPSVNAEVGLQKEVSGMETADELNKWLNAKLSIIQSTDLERIRQILFIFYLKQKDGKWERHQISVKRIREILAGISVSEKPFLSNYITDIELILNDLKPTLTAISMEWIYERILFFWASEGNFSQKQLSVFLLNEIHRKTRKPLNEVKTLLFEQARKIQRSLGSTLILDLGSDDTVKIKMQDEGATKETIQSEKIKPKVKSPMEAENDESEAIYIANAGLVLLSPFIPVLFERAGLLSNKAFIGEEKKIHAVQLLQYCAGISENNAEYEMVLPKILCGIETDEPIAYETRLSEEEKNLVESLLTNVISQWSTLGNTSISGLQETFLTRNGALRFRENSWELQVETRAFDMLLDRIPWTYSLVKYPWMQKPLRTIWR